MHCIKRREKKVLPTFMKRHGLDRLRRIVRNRPPKVASPVSRILPKPK